MPPSFKASRSRILSSLILCLFFYITYKYMFPSDKATSSTDEVTELSFNKANKEPAIQNKEKKINPVVVTVFYECLCPDSRSFFLHHLMPAYEKAPDIMEIELVPYGKAKTFIENGQYKFNCQHGKTECYGNKIHACTIEKVKDVDKQLKTISCMIDDNMNPDERGAECSALYGVSWKPILDCAASEEGVSLLKNYGDETQKLQPPVSFIPTVLLDQNQRDQAAILKNLWKEICRQFPKDSVPNECLT